MDVAKNFARLRARSFLLLAPPFKQSCIRRCKVRPNLDYWTWAVKAARSVLKEKFAYPFLINLVNLKAV